MHGKTAVFVVIAVIIAIFAYYYFALPQSSSSSEISSPDLFAESLEGVTLVKTVSGRIVGMNEEFIMLNTSEGILRLKKLEAARYLASSNGKTEPIGEKGFKRNSQASIIVGVDESTREMTALTVYIFR